MCAIFAGKSGFMAETHIAENTSQTLMVCLVIKLFLLDFSRSNIFLKIVLISALGFCANTSEMFWKIWSKQHY